MRLSETSIAIKVIKPVTDTTSALTPGFKNVSLKKDSYGGNVTWAFSSCFVVPLAF